MSESPWSLVFLIASLALLLLLGWWTPSLIHGGRLPGSIAGVRVELESATVTEDRITSRVWSIPIVFTNAWRKPLPVPPMSNQVRIWTAQRPRYSRSHYEFYGELGFEHAVASGDGSPLLLNPGDQVIAYAMFTLSEHLSPARIQLHRWNGATTFGPFRGRVQTPDVLVPTRITHNR